MRAEFFNSLSVDDVFVFMIAAAALSVALALVMKWERLFVGFGSPHGDDAEVKEVKEGEIGFLGQPQRTFPPQLIDRRLESRRGR